MYDSRCIGTILHDAVPQATAHILGSGKYPDLRGVVSFYDIGYAVLVTSTFLGFPYESGKCRYPVLGFHIHEGTSCTGTAEDPFADAGTHYNPGDCEHPMHAGDLPSIFVNEGSSWGAVVTCRFSIKEVLGRVIIVHAMPDDFHTQPSGSSGEKIACGIIRRN